VYWNQTCVYIQADGNYVKDMTPAAIEMAIDNATSSWQSQTIPAAFVQLKHLPADGPKETTYKDGLQVIVFRSAQWCRPAMDGAPQVCYDRSATAITTVSYVNKAGDPNDGLIVDADIELNAVNNIFFDADTGQPPADPRNPADLWNTLTHEMGHMQGLDHTCRAASEPATGCEVDNNGAQRPLCSDVAAQHLTNQAYMTIYNSTMYAVANPGETRKRHPSPDDVQGITDSYPASKDPKSCTLPGSSGGCAVAGASVRPAPLGPLWPLALLGSGAGLWLGLTLRRRVGRSRPSRLPV
jgi:hypothetical protein